VPKAGPKVPLFRRALDATAVAARGMLQVGKQDPGAERVEDQAAGAARLWKLERAFDICCDPGAFSRRRVWRRQRVMTEMVKVGRVVKHLVASLEAFLEPASCRHLSEGGGSWQKSSARRHLV
jgi:hypothetical protein